jgi:hypothetical protein
VIAPSTADIRAAHSKFSWLDIGVPSPRNLIRLPWKKTAIWVLLALSSVPLHLVANSTIFTTDWAAEKFSVALVAESFLNSTPYYLPGAGLYMSTTYLDVPDDERAMAILSETAQKLHDHASSWDRLEPAQCRSSHFLGLPLKQTRDLLMIGHVKGDQKTDGWVLSQVWNKAAIDNDTFLFHQGQIPSDALNSLWWVDRCPHCWLSSHDPLPLKHQTGQEFDISWAKNGKQIAALSDSRYNELVVDYVWFPPFARSFVQ